jgi:hypothetical protein
MTTVDPDTLEVDPEVLRDIVRRFNGRLALNAAVVASGRVEMGAEAVVTRAPNARAEEVMAAESPKST